MKRPKMSEIPGQMITHLWITPEHVLETGIRTAIDDITTRVRNEMELVLQTQQIDEKLPGAINRMHVAVTIVKNEDTGK